MTPSDEDLMIAYASGSEAALGELFRRYAPILLRLAQRHVGAQADAQDVVQQTFLQLHRARLDFRPDKCFRPWVVTIALNLTRDLLRRRGRARETPVEEQKLPPLEASQPFPSEDSDVCQRVRAALSGLPREQREVIELHWFVGSPGTELEFAL